MPHPHRRFAAIEGIKHYLANATEDFRSAVLAVLTDDNGENFERLLRMAEEKCEDYRNFVGTVVVGYDYDKETDNPTVTFFPPTESISVNNDKVRSRGRSVSRRSADNIRRHKRRFEGIRADRRRAERRRDKILDPQPVDFLII